MLLKEESDSPVVHLIYDFLHTGFISACLSSKSKLDIDRQGKYFCQNQQCHALRCYYLHYFQTSHMPLLTIPFAIGSPISAYFSA